MSLSLADAPAPTLLWGHAHPRPGTAALPPLDYAKADDCELASLATQGHEPAFRELLSRYERPVFSLVFRMVRDRTLAEDIAQEAFIRAFNAIASYDPAYRFSNWIFKIANNHTIDHIRRRKLDTVSIDGSRPRPRF
ncbi:MAG: sigma-70 family RNA polymerase sigma factor [Gemmatimonadetes bacterium]|nr:sigma-70 family RNA polymerase sigma factor [Gemmatimonadota bacterium]